MMIKGFREFLLRGNIVDLAVAVVIGTAFTALIGAFTANIITPVLNVFAGTTAPSWGFTITDNEATRVNVGALVTAAVSFVITAAIVYFLFVVPMNTLRQMRAQGEEPEPASPAEDVLLLREIRDLLRAQHEAEPAGPEAGGSPVGRTGGSKPGA